MLCHDGQLWNSSVITPFFSDNRTAISSATSKYGTVPERLSRSEEPTNRIEEQTGNVPSSYLVLPQKMFSEIICILLVIEHEILSYLAPFFFTVTNGCNILYCFTIMEYV